MKQPRESSGVGCGACGGLNDLLVSAPLAVLVTVGGNGMHSHIGGNMFCPECGKECNRVREEDFPYNPLYQCDEHGYFQYLAELYGGPVYSCLGEKEPDCLSLEVAKHLK